MTLQSRKIRFLGMNVRGTPSMPAEFVRHDMRVFEDECDVGVVQEYRHPWYWRALNRVLERVGRTRWGTYPRRKAGLARPVWGAQAVFWRALHWKFVRGKQDILHSGAAGISEMRFIRAALLKDRVSGLKCWFGTTHFVVGGDEHSDGDRRKDIMREDLRVLDNFLGQLVDSGHPAVFQLDANIHPGTWAYVEFMKIVRKHKGRVIGKHGVEYLLVFSGTGVEVEVVRDWQVSTARLRTDHEGRGVTFRLVERETK